MPRRKTKIGRNFLDYFVLVCSVISFLGGITAVLFLSLYMQVSNYRPYILASFAIFLGVAGYRVWRSENID